MKILKYILFVIFLSGSEQITLSQYYLKAKSDSIILESDSVLLYLDEYRGMINWEVSYDSINWYDLRTMSDQLLIRILSKGIYRAIVTENTCNPIYSDTVYLSKKDIDILQLDLELDNLSIQDFGLNDSTETIIQCSINKEIYLNLTIPPNLNRIPEVDTITIQTVKQLLNFPDNFDCLGAINITPNGVRFLKPVKLIIEVPSYYNLDQLFVFTYFSDDNLLYPLHIRNIEGPLNGYYSINADLYHFSGVGLGKGSFSDCNQYALFQSADDYVSYFGCVFSLAGETTDDLINYLRPLYLHWYNTIVLPSIESISSLTELEFSVSEFYRWYTDGFYRFFEDEFDVLWNQAVSLIGEKVMDLIR